MGFVLRSGCEFSFYWIIYLLRSSLPFSSLDLLMNKMGNNRVVWGPNLLLMMCLAQCVTRWVLGTQVQCPADADEVGSVLIKLFLHGEHLLISREGWYVWGKDRQGPHEKGTARDRSTCASSQMGVLKGVRTLTVVQWWWVRLGPWEERIWLSAGRENNFLVWQWSPGWMAQSPWGAFPPSGNREEPALGLCSFSVPLGCDGISCTLVGALSAVFLQTLESDYSSQGSCLKGNKIGKEVGRKWKERAEQRDYECMCTCALNVEGKGGSLVVSTSLEEDSTLCCLLPDPTWINMLWEKICKDVWVCLSFLCISQFN